jgi:hypothetical protein
MTREWYNSTELVCVSRELALVPAKGAWGWFRANLALKIDKGPAAPLPPKVATLQQGLPSLAKRYAAGVPDPNSHTGAAGDLASFGFEGTQPFKHDEGGWVGTFAMTPAAQESERLNRHTRPSLDVHDVKQPSLKRDEFSERAPIPLVPAKAGTQNLNTGYPLARE